MDNTPEIKVMRAANAVFDVLVFALVLAVLVVGGYCIWDDCNIEDGSSAHEQDVYIPSDTSASKLEEFAQENPAAIGWLELYGTGIDCPVVYGEGQDGHIMEDREQTPSLEGSLFLDSRCSPDFSDLATVVYGRQADRASKLSSLGAFREQGFFDEHRFGKMTMKGGVERGLEIWAFVSGTSDDNGLFRCGMTEPVEEESYLAFLASRAARTSGQTQVSPTDRILVLSAGADEAGNGCELVVAKVLDYVPGDPFAAVPEPAQEPKASQRAVTGLPWYAVGVAGLLVLTFTLFHYLKFSARRREKFDRLVAQLGLGQDDGEQP